MENDAFILVKDALSSIKEVKGETPIANTVPQGLTSRSGANGDCVELILGSNVPVLCINRSERKKRYLPFKSLYLNNHQFWQKKGAWKFYLANSDVKEIKDKAAEKSKKILYMPSESKTSIETPQDWGLDTLPKPPPDNGFGPEYEAISVMPTGDQIQLINNDKLLLGTLIINKSHDKEAVTKALVDTARDTAMINHSILHEAVKYADNEAKKITQNLINTTCDITKMSLHLVLQGILDNDLMNTLAEKSNGTTIQHITRVFLNGLDFLAYFNRLITTTSIISKLRISYPSRYRDYYRSLMPYISNDALTLERVFKDGMRAITPDHLFQWAVGFLVHDVGKAANVEYHEGQGAYNRDIVVQHVLLGYDMIIHKTNYPREAGLITGHHHEYYGDKAGYGSLRNYLESYRKMYPFTKPDFCMAYDLGPVLEYKAFAYFPAKILEIVDIYDSIIDPKRLYHKALSSEEALIMMKQEFIEKHHMIDAVLFDIFCAFIKEKSKGGGLPQLEQVRVVKP
jgi:hypothetical protein